MADIDVREVADLPFPELDRFTLLHLSPDRVDPDLDNYGFGFGVLDRVALVERRGMRRGQVLEDVLLLALHTEREVTPSRGDIELTFWLDDDAYYEDDDDDDQHLLVLAPLSVFLKKRLPALLEHVSRGHPRPVRDVVLALCNPRNAVLGRPPGLVSPPIRYALGDVRSRMESDRAREVWDPNATLCLDGDEWLRIP